MIDTHETMVVNPAPTKENSMLTAALIVAFILISWLALTGNQEVCLD